MVLQDGCLTYIRKLHLVLVLVAQTVGGRICNEMFVSLNSEMSSFKQKTFGYSSSISFRATKSSYRDHKDL